VVSSNGEGVLDLTNSLRLALHLLQLDHFIL